MDSNQNSSSSLSTDRMLRVISNSINQPPPSSSTSSTSSTGQMLINILNAVSSPSDVSLSENEEKYNLIEHLKLYREMMGQHRHDLAEDTSQDDDEYQPQVLRSEEDREGRRDLDLGPEDGEGLDLKGRMGGSQ